MTDRFTFPMSDAGFALALHTGAAQARAGSHTTMRVEPIGMGQSAFVVTAIPAPRPNREARGCNLLTRAQ